MPEIFLSPLSWGMGQATRDIPIIRELSDRGHEVSIPSPNIPLSSISTGTLTMKGMNY